MRTIVIALTVGVLQLPTVGGELLLGAMGRSNYQIIIPDEFASPAIERSVKDAADLLQRAFAENDIALTVATEPAAQGNKPGIYLGHTKVAAASGVDFAKMEGWTYTFRVAGRNLIIAGNDQPDPIPLDRRRKREARLGGIPFLGTLKATTEFLYAYAGVRFLSPGEHGIGFLPTPVIFVPDDLDTTTRTYGKNVEISRSKDIYAIANGLEPSPGIVSNYGHYHHTVISAETHGQTNPEYFALRGGHRDTRGRHLCFSNATVRDLIYKKILEDCDTGYDTIELGQNDGFVPCSCDACHGLYGVEPTHSPTDLRSYLQDSAWGEKIWIMHRDIALRLKRDRPGKKLMMTAYSVTRHPPETFSAFPDNVLIQITHPTRESLKEWESVDVPGGFSAYTYTWGTFHVTGFTPIRAGTYIKELTNTLVDNRVRLIQNNGKPFAYGIEGINVYAFMRTMNAPGAKSLDELREEYIEAAYREAAGPMRSFYRKLHQRLEFMPEAMEYGYRRNRDPLLAFSSIYTPVLINALENQLSAAERVVKSPRARKRLEATRLEFDYLRRIVDTIHLYYAYLTKPNGASLALAVDAVEERNSWLTNLAKGKRKTGKLPSFSYRGVAQLKTNGRRLGVEPFSWNVDDMRTGSFLKQALESKRLAVKRATRAVDISADAWNKVPVHRLDKNRGETAELQEETTFQVLYDKRNLYVRFRAGLQREDMAFQPRGRDAEIWLQECINICLAPGGDKSQYYYLNVEPISNSFTDANHGFITDT
ncbi:MAG: DUF4838 domain-containing protein [Lentisphaerae bacterium]|jgi:hypothetical protein|nr:DUF4838 domain-containing protein [Lentisphaerota bacterium]MBT4821269.1 DUF4838 domain-containing protein [Lentisphaerota bacterium]MBT5607662.1 DUF4838 domain-containing protein [Lentisphaerota bacterium]MBT7060006.1 DUF4838 domain-containing protein [Lentisphaerota bacterium]MBT7843799.1 DUF4838 domain-containing protein [Lentisphaerota bacterium]